MMRHAYFMAVDDRVAKQLIKFNYLHHGCITYTYESEYMRSSSTDTERAELPLHMNAMISSVYDYWNMSSWETSRLHYCASSTGKWT